MNIESPFFRYSNNIGELLCVAGELFEISSGYWEDNLPSLVLIYFPYFGLEDGFWRRE